MQSVKYHSVEHGDRYVIYGTSVRTAWNGNDYKHTEWVGEVTTEDRARAVIERLKEIE